MIHLLESKGVRLAPLKHEYTDIDAFCFYRDAILYVFFNTSKSAKRQRFDAAHELGHLVLHSELEMDPSRSKTREAEANTNSVTSLRWWRGRQSVPARTEVNRARDETAAALAPHTASPLPLDLHDDCLGFGEELAAEVAALATHARVADAAERRTQVADEEAVDPDSPCAQP